MAGQNLGVWVVLGLLSLGVVIVGGNWLIQPESVVQEEGLQSTPKGELVGCAVEDTSLTTSLRDKAIAGTSVTHTSYISLNGDTYKTGITSASPGDKVRYLFTNTTYHDYWQDGEGIEVPCKGTLTLEGETYGNASTVSVSVFNTDANPMTSSSDCTGTNQSVTTGLSYNMKVRIDGVDRKSTNPLRCVLEASNQTSIKKLVLTGLGAVESSAGKPKIYSLAGSASEVWIYDVNSVDGATSPEGVIQVQSESNQDMTGDYFILECFSKENFIDVDGSIKNGIENADGTKQYLSHLYFKGCFE